MTHGDADENDDVLACASTAAIAEHGQASRAIWILGASGRAGRVIAAELGVAARLARGERADRATNDKVNDTYRIEIPPRMYFRSTEAIDAVSVKANMNKNTDRIVSYWIVARQDVVRCCTVRLNGRPREVELHSWQDCS
jgi:hypothetical protein